MKNLILILFLSVATSFGALVEMKWDTVTKELSRNDLKPTVAALTNSSATASSLAGWSAGKGQDSITTLATVESRLGAINIIAATEIDTIAELEAIVAGLNIIVSSEIDTLAKIEALAGAINIIQSTEIDTIAEIETLAAGVNIIVSTEIDSIAELETLLGSVNVLLKTEIDTESEFEALLFTLPEGGGANWTAVVTTNSSLSGIAYVHSVVSTNGYESLGDGATAGWDVFYDADGSNHGRFTVPTDITANWNVIWPATAGASGVFKQTVSSTNVTVSWAALVTGDLPSGATLDTEWDTIAEIETAIGALNILLETEIDASSELRALMDDESGTGVLIFADGNIGAGTATTPSAGDNDTSIATSAFVQGEKANPTLTSAIITYNATADGLSDDTYDGITLTGRNGGETVAQWELVRFNSADSEFHLADANAAGEFPARGIAVAASSDGAAITVLVNGVVRNDGWAWGTVGGPIYLSETAGALTQTAPSTSGSAVQIVGWALSDDEAYLNFSGHWVVAP